MRPAPSTAPGLLEYVVGVLRQAPRVARSAWALFREADLFGAILASLSVYALVGIAAALVAIVQLPWGLATGTAVRSLDRNRLAAEFSPAEFVRRPPPSLVAIATELRLGTIAWGALCLAGMVMTVVFAGLGTEVFIGERGQFSGAGVTAVWPRH